MVSKRDDRPHFGTEPSAVADSEVSALDQQNVYCLEERTHTDKLIASVLYSRQNRHNRSSVEGFTREQSMQ